MPADRKTLRWQIPIALACILLGVLMTLQFREQRRQNFPFTPGGSELARVTRHLEVERNKLMADLAEARDKLGRYETVMGESMGGRDAVGLLKEELDKVRMEAGLVPVRGPGVVVRLEDSPRKPGLRDDPYFYIVHDVDIQAIVNELWAAGAEAISVNGQRLVTSTSVRCVGPTILVNSVRLAAPYVITAIGAPNTLESALKMQGGVIASLEASIQKGVRVDILKRKNIVVPEFRGSSGFRYAQPVSSVSP